MSRLAKILALSTALAAVAAITAACGSEKISVPKSQAQLYRGATLFNERCAGCHTLSYAATYGSAPNVRTAQAISGPNFDQRCERPIDRVLYAIENGGFSGAYMPQNVVVGQDAIDVAKFVATYAGRQEPVQIGVPKCQDRAIGTLPPGSGTTQVASAASTTSPSTAAAGAKPKTTSRAKKSTTGTGKSAKGKTAKGKSRTGTSSGTSTSGA
ncbi:MAG TPA: c-type cytochrome [Solirubrobacteraceae bacterium]|jgi:mono/diheme cytochrome c family protein|nr:c-type cytochrome [Solirubrobacteraceae bacterium]